MTKRDMPRRPPPDDKDPLPNSDRFLELLPVMLRRIVTNFDDVSAHYHKTDRLNVPAARVLIVLATRGPMSVNALAQATSLEISRLSHLLKRLARDGWISRSRDESDQRTVIVSATRKGKLNGLQSYDRVLRLEKIVMSDFSRDEDRIVRQLLRRIYSNSVDLEDKLDS